MTPPVPVREASPSDWARLTILRAMRPQMNTSTSFEASPRAARASGNSSDGNGVTPSARYRPYVSARCENGASGT